MRNSAHTDVIDVLYEDAARCLLATICTPLLCVLWRNTIQTLVFPLGARGRLPGPCFWIGLAIGIVPLAAALFIGFVIILWMHGPVIAGVTVSIVFNLAYIIVGATVAGSLLWTHIYWDSFICLYVFQFALHIVARSVYDTWNTHVEPVGFNTYDRLRWALVLTSCSLWCAGTRCLFANTVLQALKNAHAPNTLMVAVSGLACAVWYIVPYSPQRDQFLYYALLPACAVAVEHFWHTRPMPQQQQQVQQQQQQVQVQLQIAPPPPSVPQQEPEVVPYDTSKEKVKATLSAKAREVRKARQAAPDAPASAAGGRPLIADTATSMVPLPERGAAPAPRSTGGGYNLRSNPPKKPIWH